MTVQKGITARARQHEVLDQLTLRKLGSTAGTVEATLAANPGLAKLGPHLPMGQPVRLVKGAEPSKETIYLWN